MTAEVVAQHVAYGNLDHAFAGTPATCGCARTGGTGSQPLNNGEQVHCPCSTSLQPSRTFRRARHTTRNRFNQAPPLAPESIARVHGQPRSSGQ